MTKQTVRYIVKDCSSAPVWDAVGNSIRMGFTAFAILVFHINQNKYDPMDYEEPHQFVYRRH